MVTGASRDIDAAVAEWLARDGFTVVINYSGDAGSDARTTAGYRHYRIATRAARRAMQIAWWGEVVRIELGRAAHANDPSTAGAR